MIWKISIVKTLLISPQFNFQATKFSWIQQKTCEIPFCSLLFDTDYYYKHSIIQIELVTSAHYLIKQYLNVHNFSFEITHNHLPWWGLDEQLRGGNFKLTNQKADGGGIIMPGPYVSPPLHVRLKNGQNRVKFGQISNIFESSRRFQLQLQT